MNILPVTIDAGVATLASGERLTVPARHSGEADIGIRPENIAQAAPQEPDTLKARVLHVEDVGESRIVHAALSDGTSLTLRHADDRAPPRKGDALALRLDPRRLHLFRRDGRRIE
jgi:multiple sugar transport system ATP-binding protein